ncbi:RrF2 family transcriptional regulator [Olsenella massiliensis]|nr:Rrf2 family transcriptional regulator [Olsenella massiliensis]
MAGMFSTKGRYALRVMGDLATHEGWVSLGDVAKRQGISRKYLDQVVSLMHKAGYVESMRGKGGGYRLTRRPDQITLGQILRAAEGSLAPVACLDCTNDEICPQVSRCPTVGMWRDLGAMTAEFLDGRTLADIIRREQTQDDED